MKLIYFMNYFIDISFIHLFFSVFLYLQELFARVKDDAVLWKSTSIVLVIKVFIRDEFFSNGIKWFANGTMKKIYRWNFKNIVL